MNILQTYEEIQQYSKSDIGHMIQYDQIAEYVFVWGESDKNVTLWVTNNICKLEESLFQFVLELESTKDSVTKEEIDKVTAELAAELWTAKENNILPKQYQFNKGIEAND